MKVKKLFDAITDVPNDLIEEAGRTKLRRKWNTWKRPVMIAACLALFIVTVSIFPRFGRKTEGALLDVKFPQAYAFDDIETKRAIIDSNPVEEGFFEALNEFSYKTSAQILSDSSGNTNYSPLSLYYALAMAATGAKGETAEELLSLLGVPDQAMLSVQCGNLYRWLYTDNKIGQLKIGNSLWMDQSIKWENDFIKNAAENFYAHSFSVDFSDTKTAQSMGKWIADQTHGVLKPEVKVDPEQVLSILNTVYFYDEWIDRFDKSKTAEDIFYLPDSAGVSCDFMNREYASAGFTKGEGFTRSSLSLKNAGRMIFILPDEGVSPRELLSSQEKMREAFEEGEDGHGEVVWQIPKFSFGSKFSLAETLQSFGVKAAFEPDADFSGITRQMAFITNISQETHIGIDENGVEAAAFTRIDYAGAAPPKDRADMILNRPFIYGITASDGTLLFVGICENPTAE